MELSDFEIEMIRTRLLNAIRSMILSNSGLDKMYFLGLRHNVPYALKEQDDHIRDLCEYQIPHNYIRFD